TQAMQHVVRATPRFSSETVIAVAVVEIVAAIGVGDFPLPLLAVTAPIGALARSHVQTRRAHLAGRRRHVTLAGTKHGQNDRCQNGPSHERTRVRSIRVRATRHCSQSTPSRSHYPHASYYLQVNS